MTEYPLNLFENENILHPSKLKELDNLRESIKSTLENRIHIHFTDHGLKHSDRMVVLLRDVIDRNIKFGEGKKLCEDEIFILLLSIYLHDIGMQIPEAHGIDKPPSQLTNDDYDKIREGHGEVSAEIIKEIAKTNQIKYNISLNLTKPLIRNSIDIVSEIVKKHQSKFKYDPSKKIEISNNTIRIGVLISLLRLVDQLDCSHDRVDIGKLHQYSIPNSSIMHWIACHYIDSVTVKNGYIKLYGSSPDSFPPTYIEFLNKQLIEKINKELESGDEENNCKSELWENNIQINFDNIIGKQENKFSESRWSDLPNWVIDKIQKQIPLGPPKFTESIKNEDVEKRDWMSYWGFIGNPFLDRPLAYGSEHLVETDNIITVLSETESYLKSKKGCIRLLIGERGQGKTTIFQTIKGRFSNICPVDIIDAADIATMVNTPTELHNKLFGRANSIFGDEDFDKSNFFDSVNKSSLRIICIDSLDRLPPEKNKILEQFFKQSQHTFSMIMNNIIFIISCAKRWENFLKSQEVNYLGTSNQWILDKFSTKNSKEMLSKRIESSGKKINEIFDENCITPLHAISNSNPREILINAENACRLAFNQKRKKIDVEFIQSEYKETLETAYFSFLKEKCDRNTNFKDGLTAIYWYFIDIDRRNLDRNLGVDLLSQIADHEVRREVSIYRYSTSIGYVANISSKTDKGITFEHYKLKSDVKIFFKILKESGYVVKDFLSFYSCEPCVPKEYKDEITRPLNVFDNSAEHIFYHDKARNNYIDVIKGEVGYGYNVYKKSWDALENIIVAILIKMDELNPQEYENMKQEVFYTDPRYGIPRYKKGSGKILSDQANDLTKTFMEIKKEKDLPFIHNLNSIVWVRKTRNNLLRSPSTSLHKFDDEKQKKLCKEHLQLGYRELEELYRNLKEKF